MRDDTFYDVDLIKVAIEDDISVAEMTAIVEEAHRQHPAARRYSCGYDKSRGNVGLAGPRGAVEPAKFADLMAVAGDKSTPGRSK